MPAPDVATHNVLSLLDAASQAGAAGTTGAAQEALEQAETEALDRSVPYHDYNQPDQDPLINEITEARQALGQGDLARVATLIRAAQAQAKIETQPAAPAP